MIEKEEARLAAAEQQFKLADQEQEKHILDLQNKSAAAQTYLNSRFDKTAIADTADAFIYNLDEFSCLDELTIDKIQTELELSH